MTLDERTRLNAVTQLGQPGVLKRLYAYAYWYDSFTGRRLPPAWEPEDVVHEAINRLLSGERSWDSIRFPDITVALRGIIKSLFSHLPKLEYYRQRANPTDDDGMPVDVDELNVGQEEAVSREIEYSEIRKQIESAIGDDQAAMEVYFAIIDGYTKPREIAEFLGIPVDEVNNRFRRLRRKCRNNADIEV